MTIDLRIKYKSPEKELYGIPIATNRVFEECWLPACRELQLQRIPLFLTGYPAINLDLETLPEVINELHRLVEYIAENTNQFSSECATDFIIMRIDRLLFEMENAIRNWDEIEHIRI